MFTTYRDGGQVKTFGTKEEAIAWGRQVESFEVYDDDDRQVYCEFPMPRFV